MFNDEEGGDHYFLGAPVNGSTYRMIYNDGLCQLYRRVDGVWSLLVEFTRTSIMTNFQLYLDIGASRSCTIKDLKLKPYTEA